MLINEDIMNPDGTINEKTTSEDIIRMIYENIAGMLEGNYELFTIKGFKQTLDQMKEGKKEILIGLMKIIIEENRKDIIARIPAKIDNTFCRVTLNVIYDSKSPVEMANPWSEELCDKLVEPLIGQLTDEEYRLFIKRVIEKESKDIPLGMYECIIRQLPKELQQELIRHTLEDITLTNNKGLLQVLYSGIALSLGECFKSKLQDEDLKDKIYNIINIKDHLNVENIKKLLIIQGLGIIRKIKKAEEEAYSTLPPKQIGGLDSNIKTRITNYNANLHPEPEPEELKWCTGAASDSQRRR